MKISSEKKKAIRTYLLEKIEQGSPALSKAVADALSLDQSTVHTYINELVSEGVIERIRRGEYRLLSSRHSRTFSRSTGELNSDTYAFNTFLSPYLKEFPENVRSIWAYVFSEMMNNVIDHSQSEDVIVTISQNALNTTVSIQDNGVGIFEKIRDHFGYESLEDAICELFKGKLTTDLENHSGEGIYFSSRMMDEFAILSSRKVFAVNKYDESLLCEQAEDPSGGTLVAMKLSNASRRTPREVFDAFADVEGGFTRTAIPLKNLFDASPVSRSQAKRLTNRLDRFETVTLDFEGLEWMGQGFAHQLFVVFQKAHPEIKLEPVGMNESVARMYTHVTSE